MRTEFKINFIESFDNPDTIVFLDLSTYNTLEPIRTPMLRVKKHDLNTWLDYPYIVSAENSVEACGDGLYTLELSVCPNDRLYKRFCYFHISTAIQTLKQLLCENVNDTEKIIELMDNYKLLIACQLCPNEDSNIIYQSVIKKLNKLKKCNV